MSDYILVNSNGTTYQVDMENAGTIQATDYVLVNRDGVTYKAPGDSIAPSQFTSVTLAPLSGTPNYEITAVTDISSIPEGATASYKWYQYDNATGNDGKTLRATNVTNEVSNVYTATSLDQTKYIGCTVSYLGTTISETVRSAASEAQVPIADMYGLRFDSTRATSLINSNTTNGSWTASVWFKCTTDIAHDATSGYLFGDGSDLGLSINNNTKYLQWYDGAAVHIVSDPLDINKWYHVVLSYDNGQLITYIDGETSSTDSVSLVNFSKFEIGRYTADNYLSGYLSDLYFVDGQVLPPTSFGKEFLLGWGPLDHTAIEENIQAPRESPYDTRPNMDQEWSATTTGSAYDSNYTWAKGFNGDISENSPGASGSSGTPYTAVFSTPIPLSSTDEITIYYHAPSHANFPAQINGTTTPVASSRTPTFTAGELGITSFESIGVTDQQGVCGVAVNGRILVDGPANNSQNWSQNGVGTYDTYDWYIPFKYGAEHIDDLGPAYNAAYAIGGTTATCVFPGGAITGNVLVKGSTGTSSPSGTYGNIVLKNGSTVVATMQQDTATNAPKWSNAGSVTFDTIVLDASSSSNGVAFGAIEVDGEPLVDAGAQWNTSQVWSKNTTLSGDLNPTYDNPAALFDGILVGDTGDGRVIGVSQGTMNIKFGQELSGEIDFWLRSGDSTDTFKYSIDGSAPSIEINNPQTGAGGWASLGNITINTNHGISWTNVNSGNSVIICAIRVNGQILVDAASFGANGFYLPFDPAATGFNWTITAPTEFWGDDPGLIPAHIFDGNDQTMWIPPEDGTYQNWILADVGIDDIPFTDKVEFCMSIGNAGRVTPAIGIINGADVVISAADNPANLTRTWVTIATGSGTFGGFKNFASNAAGNAYAALSGIRIDGAMLVDHSNIGVDASGNGNNFYNKGFAVGDTSYMWSDYCTGFLVGAYNDNGYTAANLFSGVRGGVGINWIQTNPVSAVVSDQSDVNHRAVFRLPSPIVVPAGQLVQVQGYTSSAASNPPTFVWTANEGLASEQSVTVPFTSNSYNGNKLWTVATGPITLETLSFCNDSYLFYILVNGVPLINANIQDTVLDTPMYDYAVLATTASGVSNGNLVAGAISNAAYKATMNVPADTEVYAEFVWQGDINDDDFIHFAEGGAGPYICSDGSSKVSVDITDGTYNYEPYEVIGIRFDSSSKQFTMFRDGVYACTGVITGSTTIFNLYAGSSPNVNIHNYGQQTFAGYNVTDNGDGTVTVDTPNNDPYASRPNMEQDWLALCDNPTTGNQGSQRVTDGNLETSCVTQAQVMTTWDFGTTFTPGVSTIRLWSASSRDYQLEGSIFLNGEDVSSYINGINDVLEWSNPIYVTDFSTFSMYRLSNDLKTRVGAIEVNGRILVDGPADNSENWSDLVTGSPHNPKKAFDGVIAGDANDGCRPALINESCSIDFGDTFASANSVKLYFTRLFESCTLSVNGSSVTTQHDSSATTVFTETVDVSNTGLNTIFWNYVPNGGTAPAYSYVSLLGIEVDGELLLDSGEQWNGSEVWSNYTAESGDSAGADSAPTLFFDGDLTTRARTPIVGGVAASITYTFTGFPTGTYRVLCLGQGTSSVVINGTQTITGQDTSSGQGIWSDVDENQLSTITLNFSEIGSNAAYLFAIELDGKILVDSNLAGGPIVCNKLFQTWTEQQATFFNAELERLGNYEAALKAVAAAYDANGSYDEGAIVSHEGELWQAVANSAQATTPAVSATTVWNRLGITV